MTAGPSPRDTCGAAKCCVVISALAAARGRKVPVAHIPRLGSLRAGLNDRFEEAAPLRCSRPDRLLRAETAANPAGTLTEPYNLVAPPLDAVCGLVFAASISASQRSSDEVGSPILGRNGKIMAQNATIYKIELSVSDMDRHYYETHKLTVAKHPSETDERLMVRLVAFALNAHEHLELTKGLSTDNEPDIWQKSLSGEIDVWVALGLPSEKVIRQSCSKAAKVIVYPYGGKTAEVWWDKVKNGTTRFDNLQVINFSEIDTAALAKLASRAMKLQVNIQDGDVMVSVDESVVYVAPGTWKGAA